MFYKRDIQKEMAEYARFPAIAILGPRQSGKTTLANLMFPKHHFVSFEEAHELALATADPKKFLADHENPHGIIIDEFQYVPELLSCIKLDIDTKKRPGYFVLTGSQNYLMNASITQSLAGRIGIITLLPFSLHELQKNKLLPKNEREFIIKGCYPRMYEPNMPALSIEKFFASYIHTYVERDARQLSSIGNLRTFQTFIGLCAGRIGQLLDISDIATNCGVSVPTIQRWISVLEASYLIFLLSPYYKNFNKRLTKRPKLYFYDTGLVCALLSIKSADDLIHNPYRGALFENFVIADLMKQFYNKGSRPPLYFWRDQNGRLEIDCLINFSMVQIPIEIKSGTKILPDSFAHMIQWNHIAQQNPENSIVIYAGDSMHRWSQGTVIPWQDCGNLIQKLEKNYTPSTAKQPKLKRKSTNKKPKDQRSKDRRSKGR